MRKIAGPLIGVGIAALVVALLFLAGGGPNRRLDASVMGTDGLAHWLKQHGTEVRSSHPRMNPLPADHSLAILPLYDTDLLDQPVEPRNDDERMADTSPRAAEQWLVEDMLSKMPVVVALPKWRYGFALTAIAHEQTQIPPREVEGLMRQLGLGGLRLRPIRNDVTEGRMIGELDSENLRLALFRAQVFDRDTLPGHCLEVIGTEEGALLLTCKPTGERLVSYWLSDPDLISNHGLSLGDHAEAALQWITRLRGQNTKPLLLAREPVWLRYEDNSPEPHERTTDDLARFFQWPLSALWLMGSAVLALAFWRGMRRFGAARGPQIDHTASSRRAAIAAKARLLRLSGADARMAAEHIRARMQDMAGQALGPASANDAGVARWLALLDRRDPGLGRDLRETAARFTPDLPHADLTRLLDQFQTLSRKASDAA